MREGWHREYLKVALQVGSSGSLRAAHGDLSMEPGRIETAERRYVESLALREGNHDVDTGASCHEVDHLVGSLCITFMVKIERYRSTGIFNKQRSADISAGIWKVPASPGREYTRPNSVRCDLAGNNWPTVCAGGNYSEY
jgi:hypothetical protein